MPITADCDGSNGARVRLWKRKRQRFANETDLKVTVTHHPPGTSKWNASSTDCSHTSHRTGAASPPPPPSQGQASQGQLLVSHQVIIQLIGAAAAAKGLKVCYEIDRNFDPNGVKASVREMAEPNIKGDEFHPEWNYTISPGQQPS